jgi:hypothetical protein
VAESELVLCCWAIRFVTELADVDFDESADGQSKIVASLDPRWRMAIAARAGNWSMHRAIVTRSRAGRGLSRVAIVGHLAAGELDGLPLMFRSITGTDREASLDLSRGDRLILLSARLVVRYPIRPWASLIC